MILQKTRLLSSCKYCISEKNLHRSELEFYLSNIRFNPSVHDKCKRLFTYDGALAVNAVKK